MSATDRRPTSRARRLLDTGGIIALTVVVMNLSTYGFQMLAARLVGPDQYGSIASLLAVQLVLSVLQMGLQATAARRIAAAPAGDTDAVGDIQQAILTIAWRSSSALAALALLASPLIEHALNLESILPAILLAVGAFPMNLVGAQAGILQGERRWAALGMVYLALGVPRLVIGACALAIRPTEGSAMAAVAVAYLAPDLVAWWFLRRSRTARSRRTKRAVPLRAMATEVAHGSFALLAFFVLSNLDIVMSRHVLSAHGSGLYAGGLILTKAVLFLPQFVSIIAFPAMSTVSRRRTVLLRSIGLVGLVGLVCVAGSIALSDLAMIFIGGSEYDGIKGRLWAFAVLGTLLAALQILVYSVLARQGRKAAWLLWAAVAVVAVIGWWGATSMSALLTLMIVTDAVLLGSLLMLSLWEMREDPRDPLLPKTESVGSVVPATAGADAHVERNS